MPGARYHLREQIIPEGFQIYQDRVEVAGVSFRRGDAVAFAKSNKSWLELERELENRHDENAIRVIGCSKGFFGTKRRFIGYVPRPIAKKIVESGLVEKFQPRLLKTYVGAGGFVEVLFQILGPKGQRLQFNPSGSQEGGHYSEYVERVKQLKSGNMTEAAIELLLKLVAETEKEAKKHGKGWGVAPWYYEQLAIIYRKEKQYDDEVNILERYDAQSKAPGVGPEKMAERLVKARKLRDKHKA